MINRAQMHRPPGPHSKDRPTSLKLRPDWSKLHPRDRLPLAGSGEAAGCWLVGLRGWLRPPAASL